MSVKKIRGINVTILRTHLPPSTLVPMQLSSLTPLLVSALFKASYQVIQNKSRSSPIGGIKKIGISSTFTSIYSCINKTAIYALDAAICIGQYLTPTYTKLTFEQVNI
jgi:hypothetical protein